METLGSESSVDVSTRTTLRLNLGSGGKRVEGFVNVDLAGDPDIVADVRSIPLGDDSVDEAMAIHVLEHLSRWEAPKALAEWHRVLKPGGRLVVEVPDLLKCCAAIIAGLDDRMGLWGLFGDPVYESDLMSHRWCYSPDELIRLFRQAGFRKVRLYNAQYHKAQRDMRIEGLK